MKILLTHEYDPAGQLISTTLATTGVAEVLMDQDGSATFCASADHDDDTDFEEGLDELYDDEPDDDVDDDEPDDDVDDDADDDEHPFNIMMRLLQGIHDYVAGMHDLLKAKMAPAPSSPSAGRACR
ncbi:MAG: hypothetical protein WC480_05215, partial [Patescibacteria group bacterium]